MKYLVNYADATYRETQKYCTLMSYKRGGFDKVFEYSPGDIPQDFKEANKKWFVVGDRQIGKYGLWRPYIIVDALNKIEDGSYLCCCDSGAYFIRNVDRLIMTMERDRQNVMFFELPLK